MPEFKFEPGRGVVKVSEEVVSGDVEAELQAAVDTAQTTLNERNASHEQLKGEFAALELQVTAKGEEVERSQVTVNAAEEDLKSATSGRDSFAEARRLESEQLGSSPQDEFAEAESDEVEIPVHQVEEAVA